MQVLGATLGVIVGWLKRGSPWACLAYGVIGLLLATLLVEAADTARDRDTMLRLRRAPRERVRR